jgi:hypothetical protein
MSPNLRRIATRSGFATAAKPTGNPSFKPKTFKEAWLSDSGAYPVMSVIAFAGVFGVVWGIWTIATHPDARISKSSRKSIFRGELKDQA